jgi:hypothetical protein
LLFPKVDSPKSNIRSRRAPLTSGSHQGAEFKAFGMVRAELLEKVRK